MLRIWIFKLLSCRERSPAHQVGENINLGDLAAYGVKFNSTSES